MRYNLFLFLFWICFANAQKVQLEYQNDKLLNYCGIGVVKQVNVNSKIVFYSDSLLKNKIKISSVVPLLNKKDYGILYYVCLKDYKNCIEILIAKNTRVFIKKSNNFIFYSWETFLKEQVISVESKNKMVISPKESINGKKIDTKNWNHDDEMEVLEIKGDWIKIKNDTQNVIYWLEWKKGEKLNVYINLLI